MNDQRVSVGQAAPDFELPDTFGNRWRLSEHKGNVTLLIFYPANETLVCTKQLCSLRNNWEKYLDTKAEIAAVSSGTVEENREFASKHRLPLTILSDADRAVTSGLINHWLLPDSFLRGLMVVDAKGIVRSHRVMLRAFRPSDHDVVVSIYEARNDAIEEKRADIRSRFARLASRQ